MQLAGEWVPYIGLHCLSIWKTKCRSKSKDINNQTHCQKQESLLKHKYIHSKITSAFVLSAQLVFRYVLIKHTLYLITSNDSAVYTSAGVHSTTWVHSWCFSFLQVKLQARPQAQKAWRKVKGLNIAIKSGQLQKASGENTRLEWYEWTEAERTAVFWIMKDLTGTQIGSVERSCMTD